MWPGVQIARTLRRTPKQDCGQPELPSGQGHGHPGQFDEEQDPAPWGAQRPEGVQGGSLALVEALADLLERGDLGELHLPALLAAHRAGLDLAADGRALCVYLGTGDLDRRGRRFGSRGGLIEQSGARGREGERGQEPSDEASCQHRDLTMSSFEMAARPGKPQEAAFAPRRSNWRKRYAGRRHSESRAGAALWAVERGLFGTSAGRP